MYQPERDIAEHLGNQSSLALTFGTDLGHSQEPESPNNFVTVYGTGGFDPETKYTLERPTIQVRVRGEKGGSSNDAYDQIKAISDELHTLTDTTINGTRYIMVLRQGDIVPLGKDENDRWVYTANFRIFRTE